MRDVVLFFFKSFIDSNIHCIDTWSGSDEHDNFIVNHISDISSLKIWQQVIIKKNI